MASSGTDSPGRTQGHGAASTGPAEETADPFLGREIGSFRIVRELARGGMATVYVGEHVIIRTLVAIKLLQSDLARDPELVQAFLDEARTVNRIGHANIVNVFDMGVLPPDHYYQVMEYLEGRELGAPGGGPMPAAEALPLLIEICDALEAAHDAGVVHRDVKPANLFVVQPPGARASIKVLDFGIAKLLGGIHGERPERAGPIGTPEYMSPEQGVSGPIDGRSDLYSLGVVAYELLTGRHPFSARGVEAWVRAHSSEVPTPPNAVNHRVPPGLSGTVLKALEKRPEDRFQTAAQLRAAFVAALEEVARAPGSEPVSSGTGMFEEPAAPTTVPADQAPTRR